MMLRRHNIRACASSVPLPMNAIGVTRTADGIAVGCGRADVLSGRCPAAAAADLLALHVVVLAIQARHLAQAAAVPAESTMQESTREAEA